MMSNGINLGKEKLKFRKEKKAKKSKYLPKEIEQVVFTVTYKEKVGEKK